MTDTTQEALDLPGYLPTPPASSGALVKAVHSTIEQLNRDGRIGPNDAARVALAVELAEVIAMKRQSGRASTIGQDAKVLAEILDGFKEDAKGADDVLVEAMAKWSEVIESLGLAPVVRPTLVAVEEDQG
jgi:hypothetical protein